MKKISIPVLAILISIAFIAQPIAVCLAQYSGNYIENAMKGHHLYNLFGEDLGKIRGVQFDAIGRPAYMIVSVNDNKVVLVPFSTLVASSGINRFVANVPRRWVQRSPGYSINAFPYP